MEEKESVKKKVDESWKDSVEKNKDKVEESVQPEEKKDDELPKDMPPLPEPDFSMFVSGMSMQALMHLGELENPVTKEKNKDIIQAKYIIDILGMLEEKTKNNLSEQEAKLLEHMLYDLRIRYVEASK